MTTPGLREELHRIGDSAPVATVPADTWSRARKARRRNLVAGVAAAAVVAAVGTGLATGLPGRDQTAPPVVGTGHYGIPDTIVALPSGLEPEQGLAVGQAAVAFLTDAGKPVVIGATDGGRYHLLDLPRADGHALALSPSGALLAYTVPHGVRVVDLVDGKVRSDVDLSDSFFGDLAVQQLDWAADFDGLLFGGPESDQGAAGRALVDTNDPYPGGEIKGDPDALWAATEQGGFVGVGTERAWFHDGPNDWKRTLDATGTPVAISAVTPAVDDLRRDGDGYRMYEHDATTDSELALPTDFPTGDLTVDGWLPGSRMVVSAGGRLLLVTYGDDASMTQIGTDTSAADAMTIATDLMTG